MLYPIELRAPSANVGRNAKRRNTTRERAAQRRWQVAEPTQRQQLRQGRRAASTLASTPAGATSSASLGATLPSLDEAVADEAMSAQPGPPPRIPPAGSSGTNNVNREPVPS